MAFGSDLKPVKPVPAHPLGESKPEIDRFDEILQEIAERKDFLDEMDSLGQGDKHRNIIMTEISQVRTYSGTSLIQIHDLQTPYSTCIKDS